MTTSGRKCLFHFLNFSSLIGGIFMDKRRSACKSIDEYIQSFPRHIQSKLEELREVIKDLAPQAQEKISYQIPTFFLNGNLVHFAAYTNHIGFYPGSAAINVYKAELSKYKLSKGTIQFPLTEPIPLNLIKKIVKFRVKVNTAKNKRKSIK
jgi:uncharacterized protein YdhG (YjbR/CyaY superfamily)